MNREEFENAITALPQDFFFFEENFEKWESFKESTKNTIPYLKPDTNPIAEEDLQIAFQQMLSLTGSFKDGKTIADAIGICEKQFKATPTNDLDFDEDVLRKVTEANTEKILTNSTNNSKKPAVLKNQSSVVLEKKPSAVVKNQTSAVSKNQSSAALESKSSAVSENQSSAAGPSSKKPRPNKPADNFAGVRPQYICEECTETDRMLTLKAIEVLTNKEGGGGWVLVFDR